MRPIPISAAKRIAEAYGYDQVVILGRKVGDGGREHLTTYGANPEHCGIAARMGEVLRKFMGWTPETTVDHEEAVEGRFCAGCHGCVMDCDCWEDL